MREQSRFWECTTLYLWTKVEVWADSLMACKKLTSMRKRWSIISKALAENTMGIFSEASFHTHPHCFPFFDKGDCRSRLSCVGGDRRFSVSGRELETCDKGEAAQGYHSNSVASQAPWHLGISEPDQSFRVRYSDSFGHNFSHFARLSYVTCYFKRSCEGTFSWLSKHPPQHVLNENMKF